MVGYSFVVVPMALFVVLFCRFVQGYITGYLGLSTPKFLTLKMVFLPSYTDQLLCVVENYGFVSLNPSLLSSGQLYLPPSTTRDLGLEWGIPSSYMRPQRVTSGSS